MCDLKLGKLKKEGVLQRGDPVSSPRLGACHVESIDSLNTITVKNQAGKLYRLSGLSFGANARMRSQAAA